MDIEQPDSGTQPLEDRMAAVLGVQMEDEPEAPAPTEADTPVESEQAEAEPADLPSQQQDTPEEFEFEWGGQKYKLPSALREVTDGHLRQADYTRKTQELAEQRKWVQTQAQAIAQQQEMARAMQGEISELQTLDRQLEQYKKLDWSKLWDEDPVQAGKLRLARDEIREARESLAQQLGAKQQEMQAAQRAQMQEVLQRGVETLKREIPDWSADKAKAIRTTMTEYGFSGAELDAITDPRAVRIMHDAMQWRTLQAKKPATMQKAAAAPKTLKPTAGQPSPAQATHEKARERLRRSGRIEDALAAYTKG